MAYDGLVIREAVDEDMRQVLDIEYRCFPNPYPLDLLRKLRFFYPDTFLVAEVKGRVVGYIIGALRWFKTGHVLAIGVEPDFRSKGIGSQLMLEVIQRLKTMGAKLVRLEVRKSNHRAQNFYRKLGFVEKFEVPFYYEDGETAIAMERGL